MKINQDYKRVYRAGYCIDKRTYRRHCESAHTLLIAIFLAVILLFIAIGTAEADEIPRDVAVHCILGEARDQGLDGLTAVAEALRNRGTTKGVYGCKATFKEPKWVWDMGRKAWNQSAS